MAKQKRPYFFVSSKKTSHLPNHILRYRMCQVLGSQYFAFFSAISLSNWTIFFLNNLQISCSTRIQKKNFEKSFLRSLKIKNTKKIVKKTMKVMLNFSKFLQNRVFQVFLRGYNVFYPKNEMCKKIDLDRLFEPTTSWVRMGRIHGWTQEVESSNHRSKPTFLHI